MPPSDSANAIDRPFARLRTGAPYTACVVILAGVAFGLFAIPAPPAQYQGSCRVQLPADSPVAIEAIRLKKAVALANAHLSPAGVEQIWTSLWDESRLAETPSTKIEFRLTFSDQPTIEGTLAAASRQIEASLEEQRCDEIGASQRAQQAALAALNAALDREGSLQRELGKCELEFDRRAEANRRTLATPSKVAANPEWVLIARSLSSASRVLETLLSSYQPRHPRVIQQQNTVDQLQESLSAVPPHLPVVAETTPAYAHRRDANLSERVEETAEHRQLSKQLERAIAARRVASDAMTAANTAAVKEASSSPAIGPIQMQTLHPGWFSGRTLAIFGFAAAAGLLALALRKSTLRVEPRESTPSELLGMPVLGWLGEERALAMGTNPAGAVSQLFLRSIVTCSEVILLASMLGTVLSAVSG